MKWQEDGAGSRQDVIGYLNGLAARLAGRTLTVEGQAVNMPDDDLEYTVKYSEDEGEGEVSFKVTWSR